MLDCRQIERLYNRQSGCSKELEATISSESFKCFNFCNMVSSRLADYLDISMTLAVTSQVQLNQNTIHSSF